jgi:carboxylate-amine ligase
MDTLVTAGAISTIREVWWDVRPHPDFGTVELRMCDGMTNLDEICAVAALAQSLVADLSARAVEGEPLPLAREWVVRENKWLAARYGLDAELIVDDRGNRRPAVELIHALVDRLGDVAAGLGCSTELAEVRRMVERGSSSSRQRAIVANGGTMVDVVDLLVREFDGATLP